MDNNKALISKSTATLPTQYKRKFEQMMDQIEFDTEEDEDKEKMNYAIDPDTIMEYTNMEIAIKDVCKIISSYAEVFQHPGCILKPVDWYYVYGQPKYKNQIDQRKQEIAIYYGSESPEFLYKTISYCRFWMAGGNGMLIEEPGRSLVLISINKFPPVRFNLPLGEEVVHFNAAPGVFPWIQTQQNTYRLNRTNGIDMYYPLSEYPINNDNKLQKMYGPYTHTHIKLPEQFQFYIPFEKL